jgi:hypothetical protein
MGKMEELLKAMALLEKMRPSIGEAGYGTRVKHILAASFPVFDAFVATVNAPIVINLVDDKNHGRNNDDDDCVTVSVRPRTNSGTTLAIKTPTIVEDDPADLHNIVLWQGNPIDKMVSPYNSDNNHDDRTPGPVVFNSY